MSQPADSWDDMRARTWDLYEDGKPSASLETLLGALGASRRPLASQQAALRSWLGSAAAVPAPVALKSAVRKFLAVPVAE